MNKGQYHYTRRWRDKAKNSGMTRVDIQVPTDRVDELKAMVAQWRAEAKAKKDEIN